VAKAGLSCVASGDFHRLEHLQGWKSVVPCPRDEEALIAHLRSRRPSSSRRSASKRSALPP